VAGGAKQCIPMVGSCSSSCRFTGCNSPEAPICNILTGMCTAGLGVCDPCTSDSDCAGDSVCLEFQASGRYCFARCAASGRCPTGFACSRSAEEAAICLPISGTCDRCAETSCPPLTPSCDPESGNCVECLSPSDCGPNEICGLTTHTCMPATTPCERLEDGTLTCASGDSDTVANQPYCLDSYCVECITDLDCKTVNRSGNGSDSDSNGSDSSDNGTASNASESDSNGTDSNVTGNGDSTLICLRHQCVPQSDFCVHVQCPDGTDCDTDSRRCVPLPKACSDDSECNFGRLCDTERGDCYDPTGICSIDAECPQPLVCDQDEHFCSGCRQNSDCRHGQQCVPRPIDSSSDGTCSTPPCRLCVP